MSHINDLRRTQGHKGHSSKPTTFHGIEGEGQRYMHSGPAGHTRRHHRLYPAQGRPGHYSLPDKYDYLMGKHKGSKKRIAAHNKAHGITGGRRRGRKSRSTRRR
jgi:hypothetical protein